MPATVEVATKAPEGAPDDRFRHRGLAMTRIETFTDAAFAFALTLLVVTLDPPGSYAELATALRDAPAFLLSAVLLIMFWWGHHGWSRRYGLEDGATILLSALLVCTILIYVYPLRFLFGTMMTWIGMMTGLGIGSGAHVISEPGDVNALFVIYGAGFSSMCLALALLYAHAWRRRDQLGLSDFERFDTLALGGVWVILGATGIISMLTAALAPSTLVGLPGWVYAALPIVMPLYGRWTTRAWKRRAAAIPPNPISESGPPPRPH